MKVGELICDIETASEGEESIRETHEATSGPETTTTADQQLPTTREEPVESAPEIARQDPSPVSPADQQAKEKEDNVEDSSLFASRDPTMDTAGSGGQFSGEAAMLPSAPPPPVGLIITIPPPTRVRYNEERAAGER